MRGVQGNEVTKDMVYPPHRGVALWHIKNLRAPLLCSVALASENTYSSSHTYKKEEERAGPLSKRDPKHVNRFLLALPSAWDTLRGHRNLFAPNVLRFSARLQTSTFARLPAAALFGDCSIGFPLERVMNSRAVGALA